MVGWHQPLEGHEVGQAPGVGDGQGSLVCCSLWGHKESDTTEQLNCTVHRQHIKKQRHYFANEGPSSHSYGFSRKSYIDVSVGP